MGRDGSVRPATPDASEKVRRRAAREMVGDDHERQLRALLEYVRDGFARLDAGELDAFDLDDLIHRYKRSARQLLEALRPRRERREGDRGRP